MEDTEFSNGERILLSLFGLISLVVVGGLIFAPDRRHGRRRAEGRALRHVAPLTAGLDRVGRAGRGDARGGRHRPGHDGGLGGVRLVGGGLLRGRRAGDVLRLLPVFYRGLRGREAHAVLLGGDAF